MSRENPNPRTRTPSRTSYGCRPDAVAPADLGDAVPVLDDSEAVVSERLKEYERKTLPLTGYYRQKGRLREVDGDREVAEVTREITGMIESNRAVQAGR